MAWGSADKQALRYAVSLRSLGGVRSSVAKGEVKVAAGSVTDTLNDSIQEASWALNFCVRGSVEVESTRGAEELLQWRMDSELPVDIMDRHAERESDLRAR